ncbi:SDR family NAD(P)-dependent oxidoreductase [Streptomyces sp. NPDC017529]|uniref:SDR family NAD(P)-dependent oxidoreductase n=1 Tax=Streptomyces sp. NPDC017529 TaxID=3365000 RepID=UPI0037B0B82C
MTRYADRKAVVVGETTGIGLAIAKRLVEGGAQVVLAARSAQERAHMSDELGSAARVVAPEHVETALSAVDYLFADTVAAVRPLVPYLQGDGAVVIITSASLPGSVSRLASELAPCGIRVNAVAPSCIEASGQSSAPLPPLGRLGAAEEVARAALFLATDATFTTGTRLPVDGGLGSS